MTEDEKKEIRRSILFYNLTPEELSEAEEDIRLHVEYFAKDTRILNVGDIVKEAGYILSGSVFLETTDENGNRTILGNTTAGQMFAEGPAFFECIPITFDVVAAEDTKVLFVDISHIHRENVKLRSWYEKFVRNLLFLANQRNLLLTSRILQTTPKNIRGRVLAYLNSRAVYLRRDEFDIPYDRQQLADYLNVDRSALSAELSAMQKDGLITFHRNHFRLLKSDENARESEITS